MFYKLDNKLISPGGDSSITSLCYDIDLYFNIKIFVISYTLYSIRISPKVLCALKQWFIYDADPDDTFNSTHFLWLFHRSKVNLI